MARVALGTVRWALVAVLTVTAVWKFASLDAFRAALESMGFFPSSVSGLLAWGVPLVELVTAVLLALPRLEAPGLFLTMLQAGSFAGFHLYLYWKGIIVPCGCAGIRETDLGRTDHLVMSVGCALMFLAAVILVCSPACRRRPQDASVQRPS